MKIGIIAPYDVLSSAEGASIRVNQLANGLVLMEQPFAFYTMVLRNNAPTLILNISSHII